MFTLRWTPTAHRQFDELQAAATKSAENRSRTGKSKSSRQEGLFQQVRKTLQLLAANPRHPGLQTHPYRSLQNPFDSSDKVFEAYAQNRTPGAFRVFWCYGPGKTEITIIAITHHP
jgi:hypothetical protein